MRVITSFTRPLSLTNDGALELFFLGVGSAFSKRQNQTNLLVVKGEEHLMIDFGTKAPQALHELGLRSTDIGTFLITHSHADHVGGLEEVMLMGRYLVGTRPRIVITPEYQRILWTYSLRGGSAYSELPGLQFRDYWRILRPAVVADAPRETYEIDLGELNVKMFRTMHIPATATTAAESVWSTGILLDERVMFTADTRLDRELLESFDRVYPLETIFHDCQFFTGGVHAGIGELEELPASFRKRMILVHYGDQWEEQEERVARGGFAGMGRQQQIYRFE